MTRPPDDRWDPNREHPDTRRFEPGDETAAYGPGDQTGTYGTPQAYTEGYQNPPPYGPTGAAGPGYGAPPPPPPQTPRSKNSGRTIGLAAAALAALVVLVVVGVLVARGAGNDGSSAGSASSSAPSTRGSSTTPTTTTTTTTEETTRTTSTVAPGAVVYQLTGGGDVIALRFRDGDGHTIVAATGAPWSRATTVTGGVADLTAIVVRGPVTCNILQGEQLLSSATSNGGPLSCSANLPNG
ncbi:hypothetical protein [Gordonia rhizosphera]|uniref:Uncharacterized protein n=1 Tax=Gordonia rhizosphera NBRC 16068 TaxID=1108045 RepID=K6WXW3_9ACTN|nr:hypothetical protein [Gordonia rhizosphera]GAB91379.1 hypothetical protein GORHZ_130_00020 [Gordonia rhizosphera NBRC 16068]